MADPNRTSEKAIQATEASRESYVTESLLETVRAVVVRYRDEGGELPAHLDVLDRLAAAYDSYTRVFAAAAEDAAMDDRPAT